MNIHSLIRELHEPNGSKIVLLVADGLGGLPLAPGGKTELETARTPNLDTLVREGVCGLSIPVLPGITPGSGPGHLGLFGYDPLSYRIGRGILEALGINFQVGPRDVAARGNFCTVDVNGVKLARRKVADLDKDALRGLSDSLKARIKSGVVVIASANDGKVQIVVSVTADLTSRIKAGQIVKEIAPIVGGGGGGRPDFAEAGGKQPEKIDEMLAAAESVVARLIQP